MKALLTCVAAATIWASVSLAQPSTSHFWETPGETIRDATGNIVYREVKDPRSFTMRVFDRGTWLTYHYQPNTDRVVSVDTPDGTDDYLYDSAGKWNGLTVRAQGRPLTIRATHQLVSTDNVAPVTVEQDAAGRDVSVNQAGQRIATFEYRGNGELQRVTLGRLTFTLTRDSAGIHETLTANGKVLTTATPRTAQGSKHTFPISLAAVADVLGLQNNWSEGLTTKRSATGFLMTIHNERRVIARIVELGGMRVGFDSTGTPLFYDLQINYGAPGGYTDANLTMAYNTVVPKRLVVGTNGSVEAYVPSPADGAIQSFGNFINNGQTCIAIKRIYVHRDIYAAMANAMVDMRKREDCVQSGRRNCISVPPADAPAR